MELDWFLAKGDPFRVLIRTVLSQRTRDENTDKASKRLFSRYRNAGQLAGASLREIERLIRPSGFYKVKARRIREISRIVVENGGVPRDLEGLLKLPGVGRKTANCVLVYAYREPRIPVDTHCHRIPNRIGLVRTKTPEQTERELMRIVPRDRWIEFNELFVKFGQRVCRPVRPLCYRCPIEHLCGYERKNMEGKL
jgi:endonuclease-3